MRELDKTEIYDLSELNNKELQQVLDFLCTEGEQWLKITFKNFSEGLENVGLTYVDNGWFWVYQEPTANAKELFYTLEDVQVDCSKLTEEQIKDMISIFENNGYKQWIDPEAFIIIDNFTYLRIDSENEFYITGGLDTKTTITYKKFMELFGEKEKSKEFKNLVEDNSGCRDIIGERIKEMVYPCVNKEFNNLVDVLNEELTEEYNNSQFKQIANSLADLLEYKNKMYGNSALEPLNIFNNKCKVGQRLDDKLARIKNSNELRKNDICDLIGYLILTCKENNWTNFDEFKD